MLKDEIEQRFVRMLLATGVTHEQLEHIIIDNAEGGFMKRLKPYVDLFSKEAAADIARKASQEVAH